MRTQAHTAAPASAMRDYGLVYSKFWTSSDVRDLSDDAKLLALYLLTSEHGCIAGVVRLPDGYVCADLKWVTERVSKGFAELFANGFANRCLLTDWVWVHKYLEYNCPENPNQWKAARKSASQVPPDCCWKAAFCRVFARAAGEPEPPDSNSFETVSERLPEPFRNQDSGIRNQNSGIRTQESGSQSGLADQPARTAGGVNGKSGRQTPDTNGTGNGAHPDAVGAVGYAADFAQLKAAYPRRTGSQRWADAQTWYATNLGRGFTPAVMLAGVVRYAAYCEAEAILGTRAVQQASTFLGRNRGFLEAWEPAPAKLTGSQQWLLEQQAKDAAAAAREREGDGDAQH